MKRQRSECVPKERNFKKPVLTWVPNPELVEASILSPDRPPDEAVPCNCIGRGRPVARCSLIQLNEKKKMKLKSLELEITCKAKAWEAEAHRRGVSKYSKKHWVNVRPWETTEKPAKGRGHSLEKQLNGWRRLHVLYGASPSPYQGLTLQKMKGPSKTPPEPNTPQKSQETSPQKCHDATTQQAPPKTTPQKTEDPSIATLGPIIRTPEKSENTFPKKCHDATTQQTPSNTTPQETEDPSIAKLGPIIRTPQKSQDTVSKKCHDATVHQTPSKTTPQQTEVPSIVAPNICTPEETVPQKSHGASMTTVGQKPKTTPQKTEDPSIATLGPIIRTPQKSKGTVLQKCHVAKVHPTLSKTTPQNTEDPSIATLGPIIRTPQKSKGTVLQKCHDATTHQTLSKRTPQKTEDLTIATPRTANIHVHQKSQETHTVPQKCCDATINQTLLKTSKKTEDPSIAAPNISTPKTVSQKSHDASKTTFGQKPPKTVAQKTKNPSTATPKKFEDSTKSVRQKSRSTSKQKSTSKKDNSCQTSPTIQTRVFRRSKNNKVIDSINQYLSSTPKRSTSYTSRNSDSGCRPKESWSACWSRKEVLDDQCDRESKTKLSTQSQFSELSALPKPHESFSQGTSIPSIPVKSSKPLKMECIRPVHCSAEPSMQLFSQETSNPSIPVKSSKPLETECIWPVHSSAEPPMQSFSQETSIPSIPVKSSKPLKTECIWPVHSSAEPPMQSFSQETSIPSIPVKSSKPLKTECIWPVHSSAEPPMQSFSQEMSYPSIPVKSSKPLMMECIRPVHCSAEPPMPNETDSLKTSLFQNPSEPVELTQTVSQESTGPPSPVASLPVKSLLSPPPELLKSIPAPLVDLSDTPPFKTVQLSRSMTLPPRSASPVYQSPSHDDKNADSELFKLLGSQYGTDLSTSPPTRLSDFEPFKTLPVRNSSPFQWQEPSHLKCSTPDEMETSVNNFTTLKFPQGLESCASTISSPPVSLHGEVTQLDLNESNRCESACFSGSNMSQQSLFDPDLEVGNDLQFSENVNDCSSDSVFPKRVVSERNLSSPSQMLPRSYDSMPLEPLHPNRLNLEHSEKNLQSTSSNGEVWDPLVPCYCNFCSKTSDFHSVTGICEMPQNSSNPWGQILHQPPRNEFQQTPLHPTQNATSASSYPFQRVRPVAQTEGSWIVTPSPYHGSFHVTWVPKPQPPPVLTSYAHAVKFQNREVVIEGLPSWYTDIFIFSLLQGFNLEPESVEVFRKGPLSIQGLISAQVRFERPEADAAVARLHGIQIDGMPLSCYKV